MGSRLHPERQLHMGDESTGSRQSPRESDGDVVENGGVIDDMGAIKERPAGKGPLSDGSEGLGFLKSPPTAHRQRGRGGHDDQFGPLPPGGSDAGERIRQARTGGCEHQDGPAAGEVGLDSGERSPGFVAEVDDGNGALGQRTREGRDGSADETKGV